MKARKIEQVPVCVFGERERNAVLRSALSTPKSSRAEMCFFCVRFVLGMWLLFVLILFFLFGVRRLAELSICRQNVIFVYQFFQRTGDNDKIFKNL